MLSQQQIKFIRSLQLKKFRDETGRFIAEGFKTVEEAIRNQPQNIEQLILSSGAIGNISRNSIINTSEKLTISPADFERITAQKSAQGILAVMKKQEEKALQLSDLNDITLVLDRLSDPGNFGTLIRLADWFGIKYIICSYDTVECYNPKVVQASMGSIFRVGILYRSLEEVIREAKMNSDVYVYGTSVGGSNLYQIPVRKPCLVIFGNEARGMSNELEPFIDCNLSIPSYNLSAEKAESLNVSIAAAIVCAELRRRMNG
jgi:RNA methyltransferase, TrmH family